MSGLSAMLAWALPVAQVLLATVPGVIACGPERQCAAGERYVAHPHALGSISWAHAEEECRKLHGTHLASIHSREEHLAAKAACQAVAHDEFCWVGLRDEDASAEMDWRWADGSPYDYSHWAQGEPSHGAGDEGCANLAADKKFKWNDLACSGESAGVRVQAYLCNNPAYDEAEACLCQCHECLCWGDPHCSTFDGLTHHFQGECAYYYATPCDGDYGRMPFEITGAHEACFQEGLTCVRALYVRFYGAYDAQREVYPVERMVELAEGREVHFVDPRTYVRGAAVGKAVAHHFHRQQYSFEVVDARTRSEDVAELRVYVKGAKVTAAGDGPGHQKGKRGGVMDARVRLNADFGAAAERGLSGHDAWASVWLADCYQGVSCGICGRFDGDPSNDFTTPDLAELSTAHVSSFRDMAPEDWRRTSDWGDSWADEKVSSELLGEDECSTDGEIDPKCLEDVLETCSDLWDVVCADVCEESDFDAEDWLESCTFDSCAKCGFDADRVIDGECLEMPTQTCQKICTDKPQEPIPFFANTTSAPSASLHPLTCAGRTTTWDWPTALGRGPEALFDPPQEERFAIATEWGSSEVTVTATAPFVMAATDYAGREVGFTWYLGFSAFEHSGRSLGEPTSCENRLKGPFEAARQRGALAEWWRVSADPLDLGDEAFLAYPPSPWDMTWASPERACAQVTWTRTFALSELAQCTDESGNECFAWSRSADGAWTVLAADLYLQAVSPLHGLAADEFQHQSLTVVTWPVEFRVSNHLAMVDATGVVLFGANLKAIVNDISCCGELAVSFFTWAPAYAKLARPRLSHPTTGHEWIVDWDAAEDAHYADGGDCLLRSGARCFQVFTIRLDLSDCPPDAIADVSDRYVLHFDFACRFAAANADSAHAFAYGEGDCARLQQELGDSTQVELLREVAFRDDCRGDVAEQRWTGTLSFYGDDSFTAEKSAFTMERDRVYVELATDLASVELGLSTGVTLEALYVCTTRDDAMPGSGSGKGLDSATGDGGCLGAANVDRLFVAFLREGGADPELDGVVHPIGEGATSARASFVAPPLGSTTMWVHAMVNIDVVLPEYSADGSRRRLAKGDDGSRTAYRHFGTDSGVKLRTVDEDNEAKKNEKDDDEWSDEDKELGIALAVAAVFALALLVILCMWCRACACCKRRGRNSRRIRAPELDQPL